MIDRIKRGLDPALPAREPTVADLAERYMTAHVEVNCRPGTVETFGRVVRHYIVPELGHLALSAVDRSHVSALHCKMRDKPYQANQTVGVLARMFKLAEGWGMTPPRRNPCRSVRRYKEHRRERFLTREEYQRLGRVLIDFDPEADAGKGNGREEVSCELVIAGRDAPEVLELVEETFDEVALAVQVIGHRALLPAVPLGRDVGARAMVGNAFEDGAGVAAAVGDDDVDFGAQPASRASDAVVRTPFFPPAACRCAGCERSR